MSSGNTNDNKGVELGKLGGAGVLASPPVSDGDKGSELAAAAVVPDPWIEQRWQQVVKVREYRRKHPCWSRVTSKEWMCRLPVLLPVGILVVVVGLALAEFAIWTSGTDIYLPQAKSCPTIPPASSYTIEKELFAQWHWKYSFSGFEGVLVKMCPSLKDDAAVYIDDDLVTRTDVKVFSFTNKAYVEDCHGDRIFIIESGDAWAATINSVSVFVSLEVQAPDGRVLGYVSDDNFFSDDIEVLDATTGALAATVKRRTLTLSKWQWNINVINATSPTTDPRALALLAGLRSFEGNDGCNEFFFVVGKVLAVVAGLMLLALLAGACLLKNKCDDDARNRRLMRASGFAAPTPADLEQERLAKLEEERRKFYKIMAPLRPGRDRGQV